MIAAAINIIWRVFVKTVCQSNLETAGLMQQLTKPLCLVVVWWPLMKKIAIIDIAGYYICLFHFSCYYTQNDACCWQKRENLKHLELVTKSHTKYKLNWKENKVVVCLYSTKWWERRLITRIKNEKNWLVYLDEDNRKLEKHDSIDIKCMGCLIVAK